MAKKNLNIPSIAEEMELKEKRERFADEPKPVPEKKPKRAATFGTVIDCSELNVRDGASVDAPAICQIKAGKEVEILEDAGEWVKVRILGSIEGYCMKKYIK